MIPMYSYPGPGAMRRALRRILTPLVCGAFLLAGCSKDLAEAPGRVPADPEPPAAESGTLNLSISVSGVSSARPGTYALTPEQESIVNMEQFNVLLFRADKKAAADSEFKFVRYAPAKERGNGDAAVDNNGAYQRHFTIELPQEGTNEALKYYKVMVVANYSEAGTDDAAKSEYWNRLLGENATLETARSAIRFAQGDGEIWNTANDPTPLPLWGETQTAFTTQVVRVATIHLLRAVARIDVGVNLGGEIVKDGNPTGIYDLTSPEYDGKAMDLDGHTFDIQSVALYNAARTGYVAADPRNLSADRRRAEKPTCENVLFHGQKLEYEVADNGGAKNMLRRQIYLPETPNKGVGENSAAFYIVIGGNYNGGATTYYRVDFYDRTAKDGTGTEHEDYVKPSAENRYDILRNHAYVINILRVRGEGYPTVEMAASSEPVNMEVDIRSWDTGDQMGNIVTDGQYRLALSATQLRYHLDGTAQDLEVFTDFRLENDAEASGWKLYMDQNQTAGAGDYDHTQDVHLWAEDGNGGWTELEKKEEEKDDEKKDGDGRWFWTSGLANLTGKLRVGMNRFDETHASGLMERTVRLTFTAGRMSQDVELVQDVKNTRTLSLLQQKLFYPKYPAGNQAVILKSSPAGATYYVAWTKDGKTYRMNLSDPNAGPVDGREGDLGGFEQLTDAQKEQYLPDGFMKHTDHDGSTSCSLIEFFQTVAGSDNMFTLRPSNYDEFHTADGEEPAQPRSWRFEIEGYWDADGTPDVNPERTKLDVEQSNYDVKWYVSDTPEGLVALPDNHITVEWNQDATAHIVTEPRTLSWYFVSKSDEGNLSGQEWVTNWLKFQNVTYTGPTSLGVELADNTSLQSRTVTFQASSAADGFDRSAAKLKITQKGGPLKLELLPGVGITKLPYDQGAKTYTLDFGANDTRTTVALNVRANSDWWWEWRKNAQGEELGDKTLPADGNDNYLDEYGKSVIRLHNTHPYWANMGVTPDKTLPGYVISDWLPFPSAVTKPGIDHATTVNGDDKSTERLWEQALIMRSVQGVYLAPNAMSDNAVTARTIPLAGRYCSEIQLYNKHDLLQPDTQPEDQQKIDDASKILRIQRTVPSMTFMQLPFNGQNDVSLSNFQDPELPTGETEWKKQTIAIRSNNKVTITFESAFGKNAQWQPRGSITLYPEEANYSTVLQTTLGELNDRINAQNGNDKNNMFIDPDKVGYETDGGYRQYRITISGYRQKEKDGADEAFTTVLNYYSGYWIVHPATAQIDRHGKYSYGGFDLLLDFSGSAYHKDQRIRVGRRKYHIGSYNSGTHAFIGAAETMPVGDPEYTVYKLDGSKYQRYIKYPVPHNGEKEYFYIYWVEYKPYGGGPDDWKTVWSDDGYGSKPSWNGFLFSQEAYSPNSLVFLQHGPVVPAIPGPATMNQGEAGGYVDSWNNKANFAEDMASITIKEQYTIQYEIYRRQNLSDPFTGNTFGVTCDAGNNNVPGKPFCSQATVNAYKALWPDEGERHVFRGWKVYVYGTHSCFGSRQHHRGSTVRGYWSRSVWSKCPDGHGITRPYMQIFETITPTYITTASEDLRGPLELMVVRNAITTRPGSLPAYNMGLEGTEQKPVTR